MTVARWKCINVVYHVQLLHVFVAIVPNQPILKQYLMIKSVKYTVPIVINTNNYTRFRTLIQLTKGTHRMVLHIQHMCADILGHKWSQKRVSVRNTHTRHHRSTLR